MQIEIRKTRMSDAEDLFKILNHKDVKKELGFDKKFTLKNFKEDIKQSQKDWRSGKAYVFTVIIDGKIAGQSMLEDPDDTKKRYVAGGFLSKEYWNQGIATKGLKELVKFGFKELKLHKIVGDHDGCNPSSGKVMEKAGFKREGVFKKDQFRQGKWQDVIHYGIRRCK